MTNICYFLTNKTNPKYTYVGITNKFSRRIREHNSGKGAQYTKRYKTWFYFIHVCGFESRRVCAQFEWAMKHKRKGCGGIKGRIRTLEHLLTVDNWTKSAPNTCEMNLVIKVRMSEERYVKYTKLTKKEFNEKKEKQKKYIKYTFN